MTHIGFISTQPVKQHMSTTTEEAPVKVESKMIPASTELPPDVNAKLEAVRLKDDRTRAYTLRQIITEWAARQPAVKRLSR